MHELKSRYKYDVEAGCDEAGRGCLAGPVFAAAVILPEDFRHPLLNDSKQLTEHQRDKLRPVIEREAVSWACAMLDNEEIDEMNILNASIEAMHRALEKLNERPEGILVDGNRFKPFENIEHICFVKGDGKWMNIAAASILAKTHRDEFMCSIHEKYPEYGWDRNKGYPTQLHRQAIRSHGPSPFHRKTFRLLPQQIELFS